MAELALGVIIICLPTLPSLLRRNRSNHSLGNPFETEHSPQYPANDRYYRLNRPRLSDNGRQFSKTDRVEPPDTTVQAEHVINEIHGGYLGEAPRSRYDDNPEPGMILKTVTIEQRHTCS